MLCHAGLCCRQLVLSLTGAFWKPSWNVSQNSPWKLSSSNLLWSRVAPGCTCLSTELARGIPCQRRRDTPGPGADCKKCKPIQGAGRFYLCKTCWSAMPVWVSCLPTEYSRILYSLVENRGRLGVGRGGGTKIFFTLPPQFYHCAHLRCLGSCPTWLPVVPSVKIVGVERWECGWGWPSEPSTLQKVTTTYEVDSPLLQQRDYWVERGNWVLKQNLRLRN